MKKIISLVTILILNITHLNTMVIYANNKNTNINSTQILQRKLNIEKSKKNINMQKLQEKQMIIDAYKYLEGKN